MVLHKSFSFIEIVTFVTLLKITFSISLTQHALKRASQRLENSITLNEINYDNSEYPFHGNELYKTYPKQASYKEKDSQKYLQTSKYLFDDKENYPSNADQEEKRKKVTTTESGNKNNSNRKGSSAMETNTMVVIVVVLLTMIILIAIGCGIYMICKKDNPETGPGYSVAVSNRLFKACLILLLFAIHKK